MTGCKTTGLPEKIFADILILEPEYKASACRPNMHWPNALPRRRRPCAQGAATAMPLHLEDALERMFGS
jgi:hypothetical protein